MKKIKFLLISILLLCGLLSCRHIKLDKTTLIKELPKNYSSTIQGIEYPDKWWQSFKSVELNNLIEKAIIDNFTIKEAWHRLKQLEAKNNIIKSNLYPNISGFAEASTSRQRSENILTQKFSTTSFENYAVGVAGSYELDLWGRIRSDEQVAMVEAMATRQEINAAATTIAANIAEHWMNIVSQKVQKNIVIDQIQTNEIILKLIRMRFENSLVSAIDILTQEQAIEKLKATIPLIKAREEVLLNELALLTGDTAGSICKIETNKLPDIGPFPQTGLPADLISRRPDIKSASLKLKASQFSLLSAKANKKPAIKLTAQSAYGASKFTDIFDSWIINLAANLTAPIFDAGRIKATIEASEAGVDQQLVNYFKVILNAILEVENAIIRETKQYEHLEILKDQLNLAQKEYDESHKRYIKGLCDGIFVLTKKLYLQNLHKELIQRNTELIVYRISLYRALGGTWMNDLKEGTISNDSKS